MRRKRTLISQTLFILFFLTCASYYFTLQRSNAIDTSLWLSIMVNIVFFLLICFFCFRWTKIFFKPIINIMNDLDKLRQFIQTDKYSDNYDSLLENISVNYKEYVKEPYIKECFSKYIYELDLLDIESADEYNSCDISDFINYEDICVNVNKGSADNIAASMTGLGILGTFVGLAIGLQFFNASDASAMAESIVPLIDGIKTAFYTSIYGVVVSLVLNYQIKKRLNELEVCLNDFYNIYYENVLAYPEYMSEKLNFDIQAEQKEILSSFAESVSVSLSREMKDMMVPIFDKFNDSINNFSKTVAVNQVEGLEKIVDNFVTNMNESMGNQFDNLRNTIKETCEWQQKSVSAMDSVITQVVTESDKIKQLNDALSKTVDKFDGYLEKLIHQENNLVKHMEVYEKKISTTFESLNNVCNVFEDIVENEKQMVESNMHVTSAFEKNSEMAILAQEKLVENVNLFTSGIKASINKMIEYTDEKFNNIKILLNKINDEISGSADNLSDVYVKLQADIDTSLEKTFVQFDKELANLTSYFSSALVDISDNTEKMPKVIEESYNSLKKQTGSYIETIVQLETEIKDALENISKMNEILVVNHESNTAKKKAISEEFNRNEITEATSITNEKVGEKA